MSNRCSPATPLTSRGCIPWVPPHQRSLPENMRSTTTSCERDATLWILDPSSLGASLQNKHKHHSCDFTCVLFLSLGATFCSQPEIMCEFQMMLMGYDLLKAFLSSFCFLIPVQEEQHQCIFFCLLKKRQKKMQFINTKATNPMTLQRLIELEPN